MINERMEHLDFLKNGVVNAVIFYKDSLQLELDNATLTCYTWPLVLGDSHDYNHQHPDYKNQLCQLINQPVVEVSESSKGLIITFENGELLFEKEGPREILVITDGNGEWQSYPNL